MSILRPRRSQKIILALAVVCIFAGLCGRAAMQGMHQNDLDEQLFTAIRFGSTTEVAQLLNQGADPNLFPRTSGDEIGLRALMTSLGQGHIAFRINHGLPMVGYALNGFSNEIPMSAALAKQLKAKHVLPTIVTCTDPLGKLRVLLDHHADPNIHYQGIYPLMQAVGENRADAIQLLLEHKANPDVVAANGVTSRQYASRFNNAPVLALLKSTTQR